MRRGQLSRNIAKKRGMIQSANTDSAGSPMPNKKQAKETAGNTVLPDWLQEGIRQGPLERQEAGDRY